MIIVTPAAREKLLALIREHPEDPIVRLALKDIDVDDDDIRPSADPVGDPREDPPHRGRLAFVITLESAPHDADEIQEFGGLTVAIDSQNAPRMDGVTLDYRESGGFKFIHPHQAEDDRLRIINLN